MRSYTRLHAIFMQSYFNSFCAIVHRAMYMQLLIKNTVVGSSCLNVQMYLFATYHFVNYCSIPPSQGTFSTLTSISCCQSPMLPAYISMFILCSASATGGKSSMRTAKTVDCVHHMERRMQVGLTEPSSLRGWEQGKGHRRLCKN